jgi:TetR/AcrR family transcriptional regulator
MPVGFCCERCDAVAGSRRERLAHERNETERRSEPAQHRATPLVVDLDELDRSAGPSPHERDDPVGPVVEHPADLAKRRDQPLPTIVVNNGHRRGRRSARGPTLGPDEPERPERHAPVEQCPHDPGGGRDAHREPTVDAGLGGHSDGLAGRRGRDPPCTEVRIMICIVIRITVQGNGPRASVSPVKTPPAGLSERLIAASPEILGGRSEVRLEDVAAAVGVARTTLYYYFSGRDDLVSFLLAEHLRHGAEVIEQATQGPGSPAAKLHDVTVAVIEFVATHPGLCTGLLASLGADGQMDEVLHANEALIASPIRDLVSAGIAAGELRDGDADDITNALLGGILLVVLARAAQQRDTTPATAQQLADQLLQGPLA